MSHRYKVLHLKLDKKLYVTFCVKMLFVIVTETHWQFIKENTFHQGFLIRVHRSLIKFRMFINLGGGNN